MQSLNDDERKQVLGEVLADELKVISEYLRELPTMKQELHQVHAAVDDLRDRMQVFEQVVREHESEIRQLKSKAA